MSLHVGLTFDLRDDYHRRGYTEEETAEFDSLQTIDALDEALTSLGCRTERIGSVRDLAGRLVAGARWDLVFNIAEGVRGFGREAQVPALLDAYDIPYTFSDAMVLALALHKGMTKRVLRDLGVATPDFVVVESAADLATIDLPFPLFAKPVAAGTSMGVTASSRIDDRDALARRCDDLLTRFRQPVLVETFLPGREVTVGIVGTGREARVLGVMEVLLQPAADQGVYSYDNKAHYRGRVKYALVADALAEDARRLTLRAWRGLGCRDAGRIDLRCDADGRLHFLEVNPLAGLHPVDADIVLLCGLVGIPYRRLIAMILDSARERMLTTPPRDRSAMPSSAGGPSLV
jgi:D-alanine-D-alanine ligase